MWVARSLNLIPYLTIWIGGVGCCKYIFLEGMDDEMNEFLDEIYFQTNANTYM